MGSSQPPSNNPPPLPGGQGGQAASHQTNRAQQDSRQQKPKKRSSFTWLWGLWGLLLLIGGAGYWAWQQSIARQAMYGFQPPEMAAAQYTPKDVIGDLGGLKVRIPRHYAEYVEYDDDPSWGEKRKGPVPERTFDSKLRSFGVEARFPDMVGLENPELLQEYLSYNLNPDNPWLSFTINAGKNYPSLGANARNGRAKKLWEKNDYWRYNFERLKEDVYGLEMYVVKGVNPQTGQLARESSDTKDIYIQRDASGHVHTYIECGRPSVPKGISRCRLEFGLEPEAKVAVTVYFYPKLFPKWKEIQQSARDLLLSFEVKNNHSDTANASATKHPL